MTDDAALGDLSDLTEAALTEIQRQAELMMADLLTSANAVDAKVTTVSSVFAAVSAGMRAGAVAAAAIQSPPHPLIAALSVWGAGFLAATLVLVRGAIPSDYYGSGNEPVLIVDAARAATPDNWLIKSNIQSLQRRITFNRGVLNRSAKWMTRGYAAALSGTALGGVALLVAQICR